MSSHESLCARCARHTRTCCQGTEIYVTLGDIDRVGSATGRDDFFECRPIRNPEYADQDDDPIWRDGVLRSDGTRRVLKQQPNEDCCFLGSQGCRLTVDERPLVCRLYPFDYTADGLAESPAPGCPLYLLEEGEELIEAIGMRRGQAEVWRKQLYEEITLELKEIER